MILIWKYVSQKSYIPRRRVNFSTPRSSQYITDTVATNYIPLESVWKVSAK